MLIYSELLNARVELDGSTNNECNIIVTHKTLVRYLSTMELNVRYRVIKAELEHSVVQCVLSSEQYEKCITEFGETTKETLGKTYINYPVLTAQQIAFDRAAIKFLGLPDNVYSFLERLRDETPDGVFEEVPDAPSDGGNASSTDTESGKNPDSGKKKQDVADFVLDFGVFSGSGMTVMEAFEKARNDAKTKASIDLYLTSNVAEVRESSARYGMIALYRYAKKIGYQPQ